MVLFEPFYPFMLGAVRLAGAVPRVVTLRPENGFAISEECVREAALGGSGRAKMLVLNTPHNPTVRHGCHAAGTAHHPFPLNGRVTRLFAGPRRKHGRAGGCGPRLHRAGLGGGVGRGVRALRLSGELAPATGQCARHA
eukprot:COSAG01_NODE_650_length_14506_cov_24.157354_20_plen_139_part_00